MKKKTAVFDGLSLELQQVGFEQDPFYPLLWSYRYHLTVKSKDRTAVFPFWDQAIAYSLRFGCWPDIIMDVFYTCASQAELYYSNRDLEELSKRWGIEPSEAKALFEGTKRMYRKFIEDLGMTDDQFYSLYKKLKELFEKRNPLLKEVPIPLRMRGD